MKKAAAQRGITLLAPLAGLDFTGVIKECSAEGVRALITGVDKGKKIKSWLGRNISLSLAAYLSGRTKTGPGADGNDFQTLVLGSPLFSGEIKPLACRARETREQYFLEIEDYGLI